jgi:isoquinoline 1-oxidoreductase alpha subunit
MVTLKINSKEHTLNIESDTPLLWAIRDTVNLTGTKYGCGIQQCGACTVLIEKRPVRSCGITVGEVGDKDITTIEGLSPDSSHPVQKAWVAEQVPQCGYCQSGQIMAAVSLLERKPNPTDKDIDRGMLNLCRCGTYTRVRKAIHLAAEMMKEVS